MASKSKSKNKSSKKPKKSKKESATDNRLQDGGVEQPKSRKSLARKSSRKTECSKSNNKTRGSTAAVINKKKSAVTDHTTATKPNVEKSVRKTKSKRTTPALNPAPKTLQEVPTKIKNKSRAANLNKLSHMLARKKSRAKTATMGKSPEPSVVLEQEKSKSRKQMMKPTEPDVQMSNEMCKGQPSENYYVISEKQILDLFKNFLLNLNQPGIHSLVKETQPTALLADPSQPTAEWPKKSDLLPTPTQQQPKPHKAPEQYGPDDIVLDFEHLEYLYEDLKEVLNNIKIIQKSYQEIVSSLINLQGKPNRQIRLLPETPSELTAAATTVKRPAAVVGGNVKPTPEAALELFMNPYTRDDAFQDLFGRVDKLKLEMAEFLKAFARDGCLVPERYQSECRITYRQYATWHREITDTGFITEAILREYNKEVLELFRLSQTKMSNQTNSNNKKSMDSGPEF